MKKNGNHVGAVYSAIFMTLIGLTLTSISEEVRSPVVSYSFRQNEFELYVSGSEQIQVTNLLAKVKFSFGSYPVVERIEPPVLGPANEMSDAMSVRELVVNQQGKILLLTGTFKPEVMSFDGKFWSTHVDHISGWGLQNNGSAGGFSLSDDGNLFLPGMRIVGSRTGVYKTSPDGKRYTLFATDFWPIDLCVRNNTIYIVEDGQMTDRVTLLDEDSGALKEEVSLPPGDHRAVTVAKDGSIFVADWSGVIRNVEVSGRTIARTVIMTDSHDGSHQSPARLIDIDISPDGTHFAIGTADGHAGIVSVDFKNIQLLKLDKSGHNIFVAWPP